MNRNKTLATLSQSLLVFLVIRSTVFHWRIFSTLRHVKQNTTENIDSFLVGTAVLPIPKLYHRRIRKSEIPVSHHHATVFGRRAQRQEIMWLFRGLRILCVMLLLPGAGCCCCCERCPPEGRMVHKSFMCSIRQVVS